jgi:hypothetical protein
MGCYGELKENLSVTKSLLDYKYLLICRRELKIFDT